MGRHRKKWVEEPDARVWPFVVYIDLVRHKPKIAFMSGCVREYYPEDPGYSKFGTTNCLPDSEDTAKCTFVPPSNGLQKPISKVGYGIGGLSAPRFPVKTPGSDTPAPNTYPTVVPQMTQTRQRKEKGKSTKKTKRTKWKDFVSMYENIVKEQCLVYEKTGILSLPPTILDKKHNTQKPEPNRKTAPEPSLPAKAATVSNSHASYCHNNVAPFGMGLKSTRFQMEKENKAKLGPGIYNATLATKESFQITNPRGELIPRVRTVCSPVKYDACMNCGIDLIESDYYQTINKMKVYTRDHMQDPKFKIMHLSLCRACYCEGLKDRLQQCEKRKMPKLFIKARHCNSVHDHQEGLTEYFSKATCKVMLSMARKELLYNRFYKDEPCQVATTR